MGERETFEPVPSGSGNEGEHTDAASVAAPSTPASPAVEVLQPAADHAGGVHPKAAEPGDDPGKPVGKDAPALADLQNQVCPNCSVGVLYVTRYDPDALHEAGQERASGNNPPSLSQGYESGGGYAVKCAHCDWSASFPLNPGRYHGQGDR